MCVCSLFISSEGVAHAAAHAAQVWNTAYLPMSTTAVFDRFGASYDTSKVVDSVSMSLNVSAYNEYSPLYLPITYAMAYGVSLALSTAVITHTALYFGKDILQRLKNVRHGEKEEDVHMRLMKAYPEVPDWWYLLFLGIAVGLSIVTVAVRLLPLPASLLLSTRHVADDR